MAQTPIHPGEHLKEELRELGMSAAELARKLDVPTNRITAILGGHRAITGDTALRLGHFFGTSAELWLGLQGDYDLEEARERLAGGLQQIEPYRHEGPILLDGELVEQQREPEPAAGEPAREAAAA